MYILGLETKLAPILINSNEKRTKNESSAIIISHHFWTLSGIGKQKFHISILNVKKQFESLKLIYILSFRKTIYEFEVDLVKI